MRLFKYVLLIGFVSCGSVSPVVEPEPTDPVDVEDAGCKPHWVCKKHGCGED